MGHARLKIYAALGQAAGHTFDVDLPQSCSLLDLLHLAAEKHGFAQQLFQAPDRLSPIYTVLVNGTSVYYLEGVNTLIHAGDEIAILAFVTGG